MAAAVVRTSSADSWWRSSRASTMASASIADCCGRAGTSSPITTPAMVAWTPDSDGEPQRQPSDHVERGGGDAPARMAMTAATISPEIASGTSSMPPL